MFVLADGQNAVRDRKVFARNNCDDTGQGQRLSYIDVLDQRVWFMRAENLAGEHPRQNDVVGKLRLARALRARIDFAKRLADYIERFPVV